MCKQPIINSTIINFYQPMNTNLFAVLHSTKISAKGTRFCYEIKGSQSALARFKADTLADLNPGGYITKDGRCLYYDSRSLPLSFSCAPLYRTDEGRWGIAIAEIVSIKARADEWGEKEQAAIEMRKLAKKWEKQLDAAAEQIEAEEELTDEEDAEESKAPF